MRSVDERKKGQERVFFKEYFLHLSKMSQKMGRTFILPVVALAFVFLVLPSSASAATYYVDKTGNDGTGDGSVGNPWLTLQHAEDSVLNGDTVHVGAGTYKEDHATLHGWRTIKAVNWIADGEVVVNATAPALRVLYASGTAAISYTGFIFDADDGIDGAKSYAANFAAGTTNKTFVNCTFKDASSSLFVGSTMSGFSVSSSTFETNSSSVSSLSGAFASTTFSGNTFNITSGQSVVRIGTAGGSVVFDNNNFNISSATYIFYVTHSGDVTLTDNTFDVTSISGSTGLLFSTGSGSVTLDGNTINYADDSTIVGFLNDSWDIDITNNIFTSTYADAASALLDIRDQSSPSVTDNVFDSLSTYAESILVTSTGDDCGTVTITGNTIYSRATQGSVLKIGSESTTAGDNMLDGAVIEDNTIYGAFYYNSGLVGVTAHEILVGFNVNASIRYNTVYGGGYGIVVKGDGMGYTSGGIFYNRLVNNAGVVSLRIKGIQDITVANNVIYSSSSFSDAYYSVHIGQNGDGEVSTGVTFKNNIVYGGGESELIYLEPGSASGLSSDNNIYYRHNAGNIGISGAIYDFSGWQGLGYDTHSLNTNPLLTDPDNYDVTIAYNSPAINAGVDVGLTQDFAGVSVPQGTSPDVGLYEFYAPNSAPSALAQYESDGVTAIVTGNTVYETTVVLKMTMSSLNSSDSLTPQIEVREVGTDFTNVVTNSGNAVVYSGSPVTGTVTVSGLGDGQYHWQARINNSAGSSSWASYGGNLESAADFEVSTPTVSSFSPLDGAVDVLVDSTLSITFDRTVLAGSGNITIYDSGDAEFESFDVASDVSGFGTATISFTPSSILVPTTDYYVQVDSTAIVDSDGSVFDGISDNSTWNFTIEGKYDQTITFSSLPSKTLGDPSFNLSGTASSGLTVSYTSSDESVATISGSAVTIVGAGTTTITASQVGSVQYNAASDVTQALLVVTGSYSAAPPGGAPPAYAYFLAAPANGASYRAGDLFTLSWNAGGSNVSSVRLLFSVDGGLTNSEVIGPQPTSGSYGWTIPDWATDQGKLKVEALSSSGSVVASSFAGSTFSIFAVSEEINDSESEDSVADSSSDGEVIFTDDEPDVDSNVSGVYSSQTALDSTRSIDTDLGLEPVEVESEVYCEAGSLIRVVDSRTVYYCGVDGKRYGFPNERIYLTWFEPSDSIVAISAEKLARIPLGGNVRYRPGRRMIKIQSDPKTYAVARGGVLRWVTTERVAEVLYGSDWNQMIDDVDVALFFSYAIGEPITEADLGLADNDGFTPSVRGAFFPVDSGSEEFMFFSTDLAQGDSGEEVFRLQQFLNSHGYVLTESGPGSPGNETDWFGNLTRQALTEYQSNNGLVPASGFLDTATREDINHKLVD